MTHLSEEDRQRLRLLTKAVKLNLSAGEWSINGERIDKETVKLLMRLTGDSPVASSPNRPLVEFTHPKVVTEVMTFEEASRLYARLSHITRKSRKEVKQDFLDSLRSGYSVCIGLVSFKEFKRVS